MCIIMVTDGVDIPVEHLANGWANNSDGGGFMFINPDSGELEIHKGLMTFEAWLDDWDACWTEYGQHSPFIAHFRIGTHGPNDAANTHPHKVTDRIALVHNGMIGGLAYKQKDKRSDTRVFIDNTLRLLPEGWVNNPAILDLVEDRLGTDKMAFLSPDIVGSVVILNEHRGHWKDKIWYSNRTFERDGWRTFATTSWGKGSDGWSDVDMEEGDAAPFGSSPSSMSSASRQEWTFLVEGGDDVTISFMDQCSLCGDEIKEPWCWDCMWCSTCDTPMGDPCGCEEYKAWLRWDGWGEEYLEQLGADVNDHRAVAAYVKRLHEMSEEELADATQ